MEYLPTYETNTSECGPAVGPLMRDMVAESFPEHDPTTIIQLTSGECKPAEGYTSARWVNLGVGDIDWIGRIIIHRTGHDLATMRHRVTVERYIPTLEQA